MYVFCKHKKKINIQKKSLFFICNSGECYFFSLVDCFCAAYHAYDTHCGCSYWTRIYNKFRVFAASRQTFNQSHRSQQYYGGSANACNGTQTFVVQF